MGPISSRNINGEYLAVVHQLRCCRNFISMKSVRVLPGSVIGNFLHPGVLDVMGPMSSQNINPRMAEQFFTRAEECKVAAPSVNSINRNRN